MKTFRTFDIFTSSFEIQADLFFVIITLITDSGQSGQY